MVTKPKAAPSKTTHSSKSTKSVSHAPAKASKPAPAKSAASKHPQAKPAPAKAAQAKAVPAKQAPAKHAPAPAKAAAPPKPALVPAQKKPESIAKPVAPAPAGPVAGSLEAKFTKALQLYHGAKHEEALKAFQGIEEEALDHGLLSMLRTARSYMAALQPATKGGKGDKENPELIMQGHLNRKEADQVLSLVDKALKSSPERAQLHYIKATAHAQRNEAEAALQSLKKAIELEPSFHHTYRLEPDFEDVRDTAVFLPLEMS